MKTAPASSGRLWGLGAAVIVALAGSAPAQAPGWGSWGSRGPEEGAAQNTTEDLRGLIESLNSPEWAPRQHAEDALREALSDLATLEQALGEIDVELSPEARRRLMKLGEAVFQRSPRPGVGIQFSRTPAPDGVQIETTVRGFDAHEHLKSGDVIISFGGLPTPGEDQMRAAIMAHDPEDVVQVEVRRDDEIVSLQLRLGWYRDLQSPRPPDALALRQAWAMRAARHLDAGAEPVVDVGLDPSVWESAEAASRQAETALHQQRRGLAATTPQVIVAGAASDDRLVGPRAELVADEQRLQQLRQIDFQIEAISERISALQAARSRRNGEDAEAVEQLDRELARLRELRDELLARRINFRP